MRDSKIVVDEAPEPVPGDGQVLVKTLACGICGSDLHMLKFAREMADLAAESGLPPMLDPDRDVVMGHEFCAEILDHGPNTQKTLKPGTRVCSMPVLLGASGFNAVGYSNTVPGGYAEQMILNEMMLLEVPNGLSTDYAALTEPMAVGLHAVEKARLTPQDVALVIGCGPVGLAVISALKIKGAGPIVAADFSPMRRQLAEALGADIIVDPAETSPYESWEAAARIGGDAQPGGLFGALEPAARPGVLFECVGVPGVIEAMMKGAPRDARIVVAGVCMEMDHLRPILAINKELNVQFVLGYSPVEFAETLRNIAEGKINVEPLVTGHVGVAGVAGAFEELANPDKHAKILVEPWH